MDKFTCSQCNGRGERTFLVISHTEKETCECCKGTGELEEETFEEKEKTNEIQNRNDCDGAR
jgi:DnaJ-class molecular chaperone